MKILKFLCMDEHKKRKETRKTKRINVSLLIYLLPLTTSHKVYFDRQLNFFLLNCPMVSVSSKTDISYSSRVFVKKIQVADEEIHSNTYQITREVIF